MQPLIMLLVLLFPASATYQRTETCRPTGSMIVKT